VAALSGVGQYFFWLKLENAQRSRAIFRPFMFALASTLLVMSALTFFEWQFAFDPKIQTGIDRLAQANWFTKTISYVGYAFLYVADELLLAASLFALLANADVLLQLIRKHRSHLVRAGGALAHIGFALMLAGILFSSGYEDIVSVNLNPTELAGQFAPDRQQDNVQLVLNMPRYVKGYQVTYRGRNSPSEPFSNFEAITREQGFVKVAFTDALGERYTTTLPERQFVDRNAAAAEDGLYPIDLNKLEQFLRAEWQVLEPAPQLLNNRSVFALEFVSLSDSTQRFTVYPETEMNGQEGITPHPDRKIKLLEDIYVHISGIPTERHTNAILTEARIGLQGQDTLRLPGNYLLLADSLVQVGGLSQQLGSLAVRAKMRVLHNGIEYRVNPLLVIDSTQVIPSPALVPALGLEVSFVGVVMREGQDYGKLVVNVAREEDFVTFQAIRKPLINLLWLGTLLLTIGFGLAIYRRVNVKRYG
jgi:cytochrome c-type biogenesis protein CcmF